MRAKLHNKRTMRITALLYDGMPATSVSGPVEMLSTACQLAGFPPPEVCFVSPDSENVCSLGGVCVCPTSDWRCVDSTDILLVGSCGDPANEAFVFADEFRNWLNRIGKQAAYVLSICTGAFVLAQQGLLARKNATTHWVHSNTFRDRFPEVRLMANRRVTRDHNIICTSGVYEYYEATQMIIEEWFGSLHLNTCKQYLYGDIDRVQQQCLANFVSYRQHNDRQIHTLQDWMHSSDAASLTVTACADKIYLSERQMKRRFKTATGETPMNYIQKIRIAIACDKLENSQLTIDQISQLVGYSDTNHFRLLFKKFHQMTPTGYRKSTQLSGVSGEKYESLAANNQGVLT